MLLSDLSSRVTTGLQMDETVISSHIFERKSVGSIGGIEKVFSDAVEKSFHDISFEKELPLGIIGTTQRYGGRTRGRIDCYMPDMQTAIEYKAARLPRHHMDSVSGARYDFGQLVPDYLRLRDAELLKYGYLAIFVYGPLVADSRSPGRLYRSFHNQMFVDVCIARDDGKLDDGFDNQALERLGWDKAYGSAKPPAWACAVRLGNIGCILLSCRDKW